MKYYLLILLCLIITLDVSYAKLTPDTERVSELIQKKQEEVKSRMIKNIIRDRIETTNLITYNTFDNILTSLIEEKNKQAMTIDILTEFSRYAFVMSLSEDFTLKYFNTFEKKFKNYLSREGLSDNNINEILKKDLYENLSSGYVEKGQEFGLFSLSGEDERKLIVKNRRAERKKIRGIQNVIIDKIAISIISRISDLELNNDADLKKIWFNFFGSDYKQSFSPTEKEKFNLKPADTSWIAPATDNYIDSVLTIINSGITINSDINYLVGKINDLENSKNIFHELKDPMFIEKLFNVIDKSLEIFENKVLGNKALFIVGDLFEKYALYNIEEKYYEIDVEAIILALGEKYTKYTFWPIQDNWVGLELMFNIGLNTGIAPTSKLQSLLESNKQTPDLSYISEKIGLKIILYDFAYTRSHDKGEWYKYRGYYNKWDEDQSDCYLSDLHLLVYHAGFIYHIVDLTSNENFNYSQIGFGAGLTFFNSLEVNVSFVLPYSKNIVSKEHSFWNIGFDIPIIEYLGGE